MTTTAAKKTTAPRKPKKLPPYVRFATPTGVPPLVAAASVCMATLKFLRVNSLDEVQEFGESDTAECGPFRKQLSLLDLTPEQFEMFRVYEPILKLIRIKPGITVAVCPDCYTNETDGGGSTAMHGWQVISGQPPTKCRVTSGCTTKPVKAVACTRIVIQRDEQGNPIEPGSEPKVSADDFDMTVTAEQLDAATADATAPAGNDAQGSFDFDNPNAYSGAYEAGFDDFNDDFDPVAAAEDLTDFDFD